MSHNNNSQQYLSIMASSHQQQGVALLMVLLLVVSITVVAGAMLARQKIALRQYELLLTQDQVMQDVRTAERYAVALIKADTDANTNDSMQDIWARPIVPITYATHRIDIEIQDDSARFNVNNLYHDGAIDEQAFAAFERLLISVGLDKALARAVLDWQDPDTEVFAGSGSESDAYRKVAESAIAGQQIRQSSLPNQPFVSIDELKLVHGFTIDKFKKLQPYITSVPYYTPINVNTASEIVLNAMVEDSEPKQFKSFVSQVRSSGLNNIAEVMQQTPWSELTQEKREAISGLLDTRSHAFKVLIDVSSEQRGERKHRYATTFISKTALNQQQTQDGTSPQSDSQAFATRLWTYRPYF